MVLGGIRWYTEVWCDVVWCGVGEGGLMWGSMEWRGLMWVWALRRGMGCDGVHHSRNVPVQALVVVIKQPIQRRVLVLVSRIDVDRCVPQ